MTLDELKSNHAAAGAAYAAAAHAYFEAWQELHAHDLALGNSNVGVGHQPTFNDTPTVLRHPVFFPDPAAINNPMSYRSTSARVEALLASLTQG